MLSMKKSNIKFKKIVISGYYGFDNFGDEAILGVLTKKLKEYTPYIRVFSRNPKKTRKFYTVQSNLYFCLCQVIWHLMRCDILISGGGSLLQDVTSKKSLFYYLFVINTALFFRKKVVIFAQGIGPINSKIGRFLTKKTLKKCTLLTVRDDKSLFLLRGWGLNPELVCDPLFDTPYISSMPSNKVGVQLRSFKTLTDELLTKLAQQINKDFSDKEIEIYSFQDSLDLEVCKNFELTLRAINPIMQTKVIYNQASIEILDKISKLEYMIAMRFHANLVAIKYGIKTLAINYDEKVEKLAKEANIPCLSMMGNENYYEYFTQLKNLDKQDLLNFANSKHFDWSKIEELLKENL